MTRKPIILLVDDEQKLLNLVSFRLQLLGHRVITAQCGERALALAEEERPDLIILDIAMPGLDGLAVLARLKNSEELNAIPVLMLTARSEMEDVNKAMAAGAADYIVKPYDPTVLQMKIGHCLGIGKFGATTTKGEG
jgi:DNA-binding response OmpR family regulator